MVSGGQAARAPGLPVQTRDAILILRLCGGRGRASPGAVRLPGPLGGHLPLRTGRSSGPVSGVWAPCGPCVLFSV